MAAIHSTDAAASATASTGRVPALPGAASDVSASNGASEAAVNIGSGVAESEAASEASSDFEFDLAATAFDDFTPINGNPAIDTTWSAGNRHRQLGQLPCQHTEHATLEAAFSAAQENAKTANYAIIKQRQQKSRGVVKLLDVACERGGNSRASLASGQRKVSSRKVGCPFKLAICRMDGGAWRIRVKNGEHNHAAWPSASCSSIHRKRSAEERDDLAKRARWSKPREILGAERDEGRVTVARDIYNAKQARRRARMQGSTSTQTLLAELCERGWVVPPAARHDEDGHLTHLFLPSPNRCMADGFVGAIAMDSTYKTNRYVDFAFVARALYGLELVRLL